MRQDGSNASIAVGASLPAGTSNIGDVDILTMQYGFTKRLTPTVGTAAYIPGDVIGGILTFPTVNSSTGRPISIRKIAAVDKSQQSIPCTFQWFSATPAGGTYTDGAPLVYAAGDYATYETQSRILAANWLSYPATPTDSFLANSLDTGPIAIAATSLFALLIADGSFSLTDGDLILIIGGEQL